MIRFIIAITVIVFATTEVAGIESLLLLWGIVSNFGDEGIALTCTHSCIYVHFPNRIDENSTEIMFDVNVVFIVLEM
jgi:hypothetical protein